MMRAQGAINGIVVQGGTITIAGLQNNPPRPLASVVDRLKYDGVFYEYELQIFCTTQNGSGWKKFMLVSPQLDAIPTQASAKFRTRPEAHITIVEWPAAAIDSPGASAFSWYDIPIVGGIRLTRAC